MGQAQSVKLQELENGASGGGLGAKLRAARRRHIAEQQQLQPANGSANGAADSATDDGAALPPLGAAAAPGAPFRPDLSGPPVPGCDEQRLAYVESLDLLDSPPAPELENILSLISGIFGTQAALIALFGDKRIWVMAGRNFAVGDFPWRHSFCGWSMASETTTVMVVPDAHADARFTNHPYVKSGRVGFYAGTPLVASNGHRLGTLCCADPTPRAFDDHQCQVLSNFGAVVAQELEKSARMAASTKRLSASARRALADSLDQDVACALCVTACPKRGLSISHANSAIGDLSGVPPLELLGLSLWSLFTPAGPDAPPDAAAAILRDAEAAAREGKAFALRGARLIGRTADAFDLFFRPVGASSMGGVRDVAVPAFLPDAPENAAPDDTFFVTVAPSAGAFAPAARHASDGRSVDSFGSTVNGGQDHHHAREWRGSDCGDGGSACGSLSVIDGRDRCPIEGLKVGASLASGSYGRVYKGKYFGSRVAVKVLEADAVLRRDPVTGATLEAVLSKALSHPNIVSTLAWRIVHGEARLPKPAANLMGESLSIPPRKGSTAGSADSRRTGPASSCREAAASGAPNGAANGTNGHAAAASDAGGVEALASSLADYELVDGPDAGLRGRDSGRLSLDSNASAMTAWERDRLEGQTWIVLEYCDKGCLQDAVDRGWLRSGRSYANAEPDLLAVLITAREIASAMLYLHSVGVVHGDLSAYNVLLTSASPDAALAARGFTAKVSDFGLARVMDQGSRIETATYGTLTHMAPEVLEHGIVSKAADVYSFGVLLWQMCVGSRPWAGMSHAAVVRAVVQERRSLELGSETPEGVALLAGACMARDPNERPSFREVLEVLEPLGEMLEEALAGAEGAFAGGDGDA
ncbi:Mitogen-activated protein kinase kinase kinase [Monoraphidium neglectum]|uniref:Mitogen-activated protein kinase kinase kinase n=1 Tax=Monoraphidium neglectum TaxID=145388 RepID=A0A0D2MTA4_9CHLO|nr:Mitogen-activated protein kinase kinase kinase [Monoraphidium neglectum]KIZ03647.1 Mitogen-activated protein kinase kinase kinase [Monoraphidium neglectum]|eukprot:XP_013902666.1 Mitogen-activated protein kinase kinase kinase [Monoraphidium neglectum]